MSTDKRGEYYLRRPLVWTGALILMGEIMAVSFISKWEVFISAAALSLIIVIICNRYSEQRKKCSYLLHFLFLVLGLTIGIAYRYRDSTVNTDDSNPRIADLKAEIISINEKEKTISMTVKDVKRGRKFLIVLSRDGEDETDSESGEISYTEGDIVLISGDTEELQTASNPGGYSEKDYYTGKGVCCRLRTENIQKTGKKNYARYVLFLIRCRMKEGIYRNMSPKSAGIVSAMILGERGGIDDEIKKLYQENGIIHILAISSLHVMLIGAFIRKMLRSTGIPNTAAVLISMSILLMYGTMTGFAASTMRAVIMLIISMWGEKFRRTDDMATSLVIALIIMSLFTPYITLSAGCIMSVAAAFGVMVGSHMYKVLFGRERFLRVPLKYRKYVKGAVVSFVMSFSINVTMLPIVIYYYYEVPLYGMLLNLIVVPLLTVVVAAGFVAGILGGFMPGSISDMLGYFDPGRVAGYLAEGVLKLYEMLCRLIIRFPFSRIICGHTTIGFVWIYYMILVILIYAFTVYFEGHSMKAKWIDRQKNNKLASMILSGPARLYQSGAAGRISRRIRRGMKRNQQLKYSIEITTKEKLGRLLIYIAAGVVLYILFIAETSVCNMNDNGAVFLDVGQGNGFIIHGGTSGNYIYDAGSSSQEKVGEYALVPALKYYGISRIDICFITHSDLDHISGIAELIRNRELYGIEISEVVLPLGTEIDEPLSEIRSNFGKDYMYLNAGDRVSFGDITFDIIYPGGVSSDSVYSDSVYSDSVYSDSVYSDSGPSKIADGASSGNDYSLVSLMTYKDVQILYTGDISSEAERLIIEDGYISSLLDRNKKLVIACPHHGSKYSSSDEFLDFVSPDIAIISCGRHNMYGHPAPETLDRLEERGIRIYRTDLEGAVIINY